MPHFKHALAAAFIGLLSGAMLASFPAWAQVAVDLAPGTVDLSPLLDYAIGILGSTLLALAHAVGFYVLKKFKLDGDAQVRAYVESAIERGVNWGLEEVREKGMNLATFQTRNHAIAQAATYVAGKVPGGLKQLGITPEGLSEIVENRMRGVLKLEPPLADPGAQRAPAATAAAVPGAA